MATYSETLKDSVRYWWTYLIIGILFLLLSGLILTNPVISYVGLSLYFAAAIFVTGIFSIGFSIGNRKTLSGWGWYLTIGLLDLVIGFYLLTYPVVAAATLPLYISFWVLFRSFAAISTAFDLRAMGIRGWGWLLALAILGLVFSVSILFDLRLGVITTVALTCYALLSLGLLSIITGFRLRGIGKQQIPSAG